MHHTQVHATLEVAHKAAGKVEDAVNKVESAGVFAKAISASHAFRKYDWLGDVPFHNVKGNLQGMVLSSRWRTAYNISVKYGSTMERYHVGTFVTVAAGILASSDQILGVVESNSSWSTKAARLSTQATAVAMNVLTGVVTGPAHAILLSLQGYSNILDVVTRKPLGTYGQTLKAIDVSILSAATQVSDGNNIYIFVNTTINPKVSKMLGF
jgi:hypothetical protein